MSVLLGATLFAAVQGSFTIGDRSEARVRSDTVLEADGSSRRRLVTDLDTSPAALLRLWSRRVSINLGYTPRYTVRDVTTTPTGEILQRMGLSIGMMPDRRTSFSIGEDFSYGRTSFLSLGLGQTSATTTPAPGVPTVERLPLAQTLNYISSRTYFLATFQASHLVRLGTYADYATSGGTDATSKTVLPLQRAPRAEISMDVRVTRRDALVTTLRASRITFDSTEITPAFRITLFEQLEGMRHAFSRSTDGTLSFGVSEAAVAVGTDKARWKAYPLVEASLSHALTPDHVVGRATVRFAPFVDRLTGNLDYQVQGSVTGVWTPGTIRRGFVVRTAVGAAESVPPSKDQALTLITLEAATGYRTSRYVLFEVGARAISVRTKGTDPQPLLYMGFLTATFTMEPLRF